jgi:isoleucyl-tRNA synthetase
VAVLEPDPRLGSPAALYLEGSDQHRGWFQSSLLIGVATAERAPYKKVLTHGFTVDEKGEAMHKSRGNTVDPRDVIEKFGADVLRLWVISEDYRNDVKYSKEIIDRMSDAYRRIRNTFKFLLGNLWDFDPKRDAVPLEKLPEMERWMLHELGVLLDLVRKAYDDFEFHKVFFVIHGFCAVELSATYLDIVKDRLYCQATSDSERRAVQTVLHEVLDVLVRALAPILVFTTDEAWQHLHRDLASVHLAEFPEAPADWKAPEVARRWRRMLEVRSDVTRALEQARRAKQIGHSLDAEVLIYPHTEEIRELLDRYRAQLSEWFITSDCHVAEEPFAEGEITGTSDIVDVKVVRSRHAKCERCWQHRASVGQNADGTDICERCFDVVRRIG